MSPQNKLSPSLGVFVLRPDLQNLLLDFHIKKGCHPWVCFGWAICLVLSGARTHLKVPSSILSISSLCPRDRARQHCGGF